MIDEEVFLRNEGEGGLRRDGTREKTIPVSEIFGPTLEGEGPWAGQPTYFLRVGGCDYACDWCDTDQAVLPENVRKLPRLTIPEIWERLRVYVADHPGPDLLAISGGNPGLYDLSAIVNRWHAEDTAYKRKVLVETQGSRFQPWMTKVDLLTISPKPPSSGLDVATSLANVRMFWNAYALHKANEALQGRPPRKDHRPILKVVVFDEDDYRFAQAIHRKYRNVDFHLSTGTAMGGLSGKWVPPTHPGEPRSMVQLYRESAHYLPWVAEHGPIDTKDSLLARYKWLAERAMNDPVMADVKVQVQLHCLLWGVTTRGV